MEKFAALVILFALTALVRGDIQDPPSNDYGPTRKLGRGLSNLFLGSAEIPVTICKVSKEEGNNAAAGYGVVRGVGRAVSRHVAGFFEIISWPFPIWHEGYYPMLPRDIPWIHAGYSEFPSELGNESKYPYVRDY